MPASWLACVWTLGPFRENMKPSFFQVFSLLVQLQLVPPRHCVSRGVQQGGLLQKVGATLDPHATNLLVPRHMGNAIGHQIPGLDSPGLGTSGLKICPRRLRVDVRDTKFLRNCHNWHVFLTQTCTLSFFPIFSQQWRLFIFPFVRVVHFFT